MVLGELGSNMQKVETRPLSHTIHKNKLKMDKGPECETGNHQNPRGQSRKRPDLSRSNFLLDTSPKARELKAKMGVPGWHSRLSVRLQPGHNLVVREFEPRVRLWADGSEPGACFRFCVSLSLCPSPVHALSLSVPKINKR